MFSCQKLDVAVPIQVVNMDGSANASFFKERVVQKLRNRNFIVVNHRTSLQLLIKNFDVHVSSYTETVWDDCSTGGFNSYELDRENLIGVVSLIDDGVVLQEWGIEASNREVLRAGDPFLIALLLPDDEEEDCSDYYVKTKYRMDNELRACARRIAADAVRKVNRFY